eukprot:jgi/Astpho2/2540/e_gw1.00048.41.1_t
MASARAAVSCSYWGEALKWGPDNKKQSAGECCQQCMDMQPLDPEEMECNVWVYCGDKEACSSQYQDCWIKHLAHPGGSNPKRGAGVPWTSGIHQAEPAEPAQQEAPESPEDRSYHVVITAQGSATHWQARVGYYWYLKVRKQCREAGPCDMGGFTRILHSGQADELMDEIPTFVCDPVPSDNKGYVVLNRPYSFVQWLAKAQITENYVLMGEPDHLWLKPMPNLMKGLHPAAFPFFYIEPARKDYRAITERFTGALTRKQAESIPPIGNAPTLLSLKQLSIVTPVWFNTSMDIFNDAEAHKEWGWVQEMYGFAISCYKVGLPPVGLELNMMSQPPWDTELEPYYMLHYTYGMDYRLTGEHMPGEYGEWRFDKRNYAGNPPPRNLSLPPASVKSELVQHLIRALNEATDAIPGWDEYAISGKATQLWNGSIS